MDEYLDKPMAFWVLSPSFETPDLSLDDALEYAEEHEDVFEASTYNIARL